MYIQDFDIKGFKWIDIKSHIKEIQGETPNQVQVVIGTNGGGKSTLLTQLTPLPANRNDYYRGGYKKLHILHQGDEYEISSNFETKAGKHSFIKNGAELNVSGLSSLQIDLCKEHLGYTPQLDDLTHCRYRVAQMSVTERKNLFLSLSPATPDFVIQLHKLAKSMLRVKQGNIKMLLTRQAEIKDKLYTPEQIKELTEQKASVDKVQLEISNKLYHLQEKLKEYQEELGKFDQRFLDSAYVEKMLSGTKRFKKTVQDFRYRLGPGELTSETEATSEVAKLREQVKNLTETYTKLESELAEYDRAILEQQDTGKKECMDLIAKRNWELETIKEWMDYPTIPPDKLDKHIEAIQKVEEIIETFPVELKKYDGYVGNWDILNILDPNVQKVSTFAERWKNNSQAATEKIKYNESELAKIPNKGEKPACGDCADTCDYYQHFNERGQTLRNDITQLRKTREKADKKAERYKSACEKQSNMFHSLWRQSEALKGISWWLASTVWGTDIKTIAQHWVSRPSDWIAKMKKDILAQEHKAEIERILKEIDAAKTTLESLEKINAPAVKIMRQLFDTKQAELNKVKELIISLTEKLEKAQEYMELRIGFDSLREEGENFEAHLEKFYEFLTLKSCVDLLQGTIIREYQEHKESLDESVHNLTKTLKEQETLQARYKEEIVELLEKAQEDEKVCRYLELGLSPEHGMPRYQLTLFLNAILENVNFILSQIWTSSFRVSLIETHTNDNPEDADEVSFDFKATLNDKQFAPLNKLSKSEQAVVNFAFYIAMIYATGQTDYPVFFDECDDGFDAEHKRTFASWLKMYMDSSYSPQMWLICHNVETYGSLLYKDVICLNKDNIYVPTEANRHVKIEKD